MSHEEKLTDVPDEKVDEIIAQFKAEGATNIRKMKQSDGNWTVVATVPD